MERRLAALAEASGAVRKAALDAAVQEVNADPARLDRLMQEQNYRLAVWRVAAEEINYRRFFDINDLAALTNGRSTRVRVGARHAVRAACGMACFTASGLTTPTACSIRPGYFRAFRPGPPGAGGRLGPGGGRRCRCTW